jgi:hypothetical protein
VACHTKDWHMTWNIYLLKVYNLYFKHFLIILYILNKTKKSFLWVCVLWINLHKYWFFTIGRGGGGGVCWMKLLHLISRLEKIKLTNIILKGMSILNQYSWYAINLLPYNALLD